MPEEKKRLRFWPQSTIMRIFLCVALLWFGIIAAAVYLFVCNTKSMSENGCELPLSTWQDVASVAFDRKKSAHLLEAERSFLEAMTLERASDYTGAHKAFEQAITECTLCYGSKALPTCVFRMEQARFEDKFHHWRQAETLCADALKDFPEDGPLGVRYYLAQFRASILMKQRQYKEAVSAFQEAIKTAEKLKQPDRESVRYSLWWLAYAYTYNRQESEAKATYDRLLKLEREHK